MLHYFSLSVLTVDIGRFICYRYLHGSSFIGVFECIALCVLHEQLVACVSGDFLNGTRIGGGLVSTCVAGFMEFYMMSHLPSSYMTHIMVEQGCYRCIWVYLHVFTTSRWKVGLFADCGQNAGVLANILRVL